ncbi:manganese efflux pump [Pannus brasiliensis CCIBt3594]|uniref:Manganese efflux pump n=1 Tax=Pannus brasiliensis CCIBt3594 TaxID=1427578 RepID=A0AAW9QV10_9CHRO
MSINFLLLERELPYLLAIAIASNLDNLGIGLAYGIARIPLPPLPNAIIAILSGLVTYLAMVFGSFTREILSRGLANDLGALTLVVIGFWVGRETTAARWKELFLDRFQRVLQRAGILTVKFPVKRESRKTETERSPRRSGRVERWRQITLLGLALSLNAIAGGFGASLAGHDHPIDRMTIPLAIAVFSYVTIAVGQNII